MCNHFLLKKLIQIVEIFISHPMETSGAGFGYGFRDVTEEVFYLTLFQI